MPARRGYASGVGRCFTAMMICCAGPGTLQRHHHRPRTEYVERVPGRRQFLRRPRALHGGQTRPPTRANGNVSSSSTGSGATARATTRSNVPRSTGSWPQSSARPVNTRTSLDVQLRHERGQERRLLRRRLQQCQRDARPDDLQHDAREARAAPDVDHACCPAAATRARAAPPRTPSIRRSGAARPSLSKRPPRGSHGPTTPRAGERRRRTESSCASLRATPWDCAYARRSGSAMPRIVSYVDAAPCGSLQSMEGQEE